MERDTRFLIDLWVVFIVMGVLSFFAIAGTIVLIHKKITDSVKRQGTIVTRKKILAGVATFITVAVPAITGFYFKMPFTGIVTMVIIIALWVIFYEKYRF